MTTVLTDKDRVRLLISDVGGKVGTEFLFTDTEIENFIDLSPNILSAAALGLRTIAGNEAMVLKRIKFLELETDGEAVADVLHKLAENLEARGDQLEEGEEDNEIATMGLDPTSRAVLRWRHFGVME